MGRRVDVCEQINEESSLKGDGWVLTDFRFDGAEGWDEVCITRLKKAGNENGVDVVGSTVDAAKVWRSAKLEEANRIILEAYQSKSFDKYTQAKEDNLNYRLPHLDTEKLDSQNLKLVKIDLPEEEWFQFTLE